MDLFQHRLRVLHARSIEKIMNRRVINSTQNKLHKHVKYDNISTYMRKFDINRQNMNLAKRIYQCQSSLNKQNYDKQWKKNKSYMKVRSNFKKTLSSQQPKIFKFQKIGGRGNLLVEVIIKKIMPQPIHMNEKNLYFLKIITGYNKIIPSNSYLKLDQQNHEISFYLPKNPKKKNVLCKIYQVIQNDIHEKAKFKIDVYGQHEQQVMLYGKSGKTYGTVCFKLETSINKHQTCEGFSLNGAISSQSRRY